MLKYITDNLEISSDEEDSEEENYSEKVLLNEIIVKHKLSILPFSKSIFQKSLLREQF